MIIRITKQIPYREQHERKIKTGEEYKVVRTAKTVIHPKVNQYFVIVDGLERMILETDCIVIEE